MTMTRLWVLTLGPPILVGAVYALSFPSSKGDHAVRTSRLVAAGARSPRIGADDHDPLTRACHEAADELAPQLPPSCRVIVRTPFVLAGDLPEAELDRLHCETVLPVTAALWRSYFDKKPDAPVTIVALGTEERYRAAAESLDGYEPLAYSGYAQRGRRRIVLNLATGRGTLAHELAHVLAAFDFPGMPEWFDEGLAALHEDAVFSSDGLTMIGTKNWRSKLLAESLRKSEFPALETVIAAPTFRGEGEGLNYAVVRGFCHYLQHRGLLSHFYRKFRGAAHDDPSGVSTLCELLGVATVDEVDRDFRAWVLDDAGR
ncbi:MAG: hypothetical protein ACM3U2_20425 [Deltaproteobacteria bacterium]